MNIKATEASVLRGCLELLKLHGVPHWRNNTGSLRNPKGRLVRFGIVGSSDILAVLPPSGRLVCIETKRPGGRLSPAQKHFLWAVEQAGGVALVIDDLKTLDDWLRANLRHR